jgi:hypothetical protein
VPKPTPGYVKKWKKYVVRNSKETLQNTFLTVSNRLASEAAQEFCRRIGAITRPQRMRIQRPRNSTSYLVQAISKEREIKSKKRLNGLEVVLQEIKKEEQGRKVGNLERR